MLTTLGPAVGARHHRVHDGAGRRHHGCLVRWWGCRRRGSSRASRSRARPRCGRWSRSRSCCRPWWWRPRSWRCSVRGASLPTRLAGLASWRSCSRELFYNVAVVVRAGGRAVVAPRPAHRGGRAMLGASPVACLPRGDLAAAPSRRALRGVDRLPVQRHVLRPGAAAGGARARRRSRSRSTARRP